MSEKSSSYQTSDTILQLQLGTQGTKCRSLSEISELNCSVASLSPSYKSQTPAFLLLGWLQSRQLRAATTVTNAAAVWQKKQSERTEFVHGVTGPARRSGPVHLELGEAVKQQGVHIGRALRHRNILHRIV